MQQFPVLTLELARKIERNIAEGYSGASRSSPQDNVLVEQYNRFKGFRSKLQYTSLTLVVG